MVNPRAGSGGGVSAVRQTGSSRVATGGNPNNLGTYTPNIHRHRLSDPLEYHIYLKIETTTASHIVYHQCRQTVWEHYNLGKSTPTTHQQTQTFGPF